VCWYLEERIEYIRWRHNRRHLFPSLCIVRVCSAADLLPHLTLFSVPSARDHLSLTLPVVSALRFIKNTVKFHQRVTFIYYPNNEGSERNLFEMNEMKFLSHGTE
jgi:hypothetical protein